MEGSGARPIVFLSGFGYRNEWVGVCHSVLVRAAPRSPIVDLSHGVPPQDVLAGALPLADCLPYLPERAVALAVVDPGSGTDRKDIAVETPAGLDLVGPDNGVLLLAWRALGGAARCVEIGADDVLLVLLKPVAPSFHARDVLAPAAAALACGRELASLGDELDPASLVQVALAEPEVDRHRIQCEVIDVDRFGNVQLNARRDHLAFAELDDGDALAVESTASSVRARNVVTYADVEPGGYGVLVDPRGWLAVVRNRESAAEGLQVRAGDPVWITHLGDALG